MTYNPYEDYGDNKICLSVEGEFQGYAIRAYSSPDAEGRTFIDDGEQEIGEVTDFEHFGAPFAVDLVFENPVYPMEGEIEDIRDEVGSAIAAQFEGKVDDVADKIFGSDDPFETIMGMDTDDITVGEE